MTDDARRRPRAETQSGLPLQTFTGPRISAADWRYEDRLGDPGSYPFTRGPHATMYRGKPWTMRMFAGFGTPEDTNRRFKFLLEHGQTGLSTAFDMPTLMGYDPDHARSLGEVGREGVSVAHARRHERLFADIPLDKVTTSMTINAPGGRAARALRRGRRAAGRLARRSCAARCRTTCSRSSSRRRSGSAPIRGRTCGSCATCWSTARRAMPRWNTISISGYHIREAGATAVQELAFTLADGIGYVELGVDAGLDVDDFAPRLSFFWDVHNDFFEEIAKFRAAPPDVGARSCASASARRTRGRGSCARTPRRPACR